ncbi:MAG TPA: sterol desaturase family protein, partial [Cytophagaceae bacterium]|nr:sterol desaturase family protein [Cytophagaceae bacterium]
MKIIYALSIPFFLIFILGEYWYSKKKNKRFFSYSDSVSNLSIGLFERLIYVYSVAIFIGIFDYVYLHWRIFTIPNNVYAWIVLVLLTDLVWYWYHRLGHEINLFWSAHIVHHQSEEYNLTVSARITMFQALIRNIFWCIIPLLGFQTKMVVTMLLVHGLYSFFTHTRVIGKLGFIEKILVTPSHHRVHHGSNEGYLDKNYSDMFIFWDKLFGTYAEETEEVKYGLTAPLKSNSFLWQHFHYIVELLVHTSNTKGFKNKLKVLFGKPDKIPYHVRVSIERALLVQRATQKIPLSKNSKWYIGSQIIFCVGILLYLTECREIADTFTTAILFFVVFLTMINCGAMLEQRRWVFYLEFIRILSAELLIIYFFPSIFSILIASIALYTFLHYFSP